MTLIDLLNSEQKFYLTKVVDTVGYSGYRTHVGNHTGKCMDYRYMVVQTVQKGGAGNRACVGNVSV